MCVIMFDSPRCNGAIKHTHTHTCIGIAPAKQALCIISHYPTPRDFRGCCLTGHNPSVMCMPGCLEKNPRMSPVEGLYKHTHTHTHTHPPTHIHMQTQITNTHPHTNTNYQHTLTQTCTQNYEYESITLQFSVMYVCIKAWAEKFIG